MGNFARMVVLMLAVFVIHSEADLHNTVNDTNYTSSAGTAQSSTPTLPSRAFMGYYRSQQPTNQSSNNLSERYPVNSDLLLSNLERIANIQIRAARGENIGFSELGTPYSTWPQCNQSSVYRTIDGTCNDLQNPWNGAAKTPLTRLTTSRYEDGISDARTTHFKSDGVLPTARQISLGVYVSRSNLSVKHNHLLMSYGQFLDHDITLSPESGGEGGEDAEKEQCCDAVGTQTHTGNSSSSSSSSRECFPLMTENDPVFTRTCIPFLRSAPVPGLPGKIMERYQLNDLTSWIDGSQIYGNTLLKSKELRSFVNGKLRFELKQDGSEGLPVRDDNPADCTVSTVSCRFAAGDVRNSEQAGLTSMHTLLLQEHNRIATALSRINPHWDDELTYQTTRKIVGAILQRITYSEWLPTILGPKLMTQYRLNLFDRARLTRYTPSYDASIITEFSTAAFRFGHSLVRQTFSLPDDGNSDIGDMFKSFQMMSNQGSNALLKGMLKDHVEAFDRFISEGLRNNLFNQELDLIALNVQRGRDHGLSSYNNVRRYFRLPVYDTYEAMASDGHSVQVVNAMRETYPDPEDVELFVGGLSEQPVAGSVVGETFAHIIAEQFKRLKYADRFWHESRDMKLGFNNRQLYEIRKASFALLFCENIPGVKVQKKLLWLRSASNPEVDCNTLQSINLNAWRKNSPRVQQTRSRRKATAKVRRKRERRQRL